jgi:hypothetical protein
VHPWWRGTRCNACRRNLIGKGLTSAASPRVHISSTCKLGQKLGVSLPLLTCSPSAWPSWLLYRKSWKSRRDLWITLYCVPDFRVVNFHYLLSSIDRDFVVSEGKKNYTAWPRNIFWPVGHIWYLFHTIKNSDMSTFVANMQCVFCEERIIICAGLTGFTY